MHILMTADTVGGVWAYALDLARGLIARDVAVTIAVLGPPPRADQMRALPACRIVMLDLPLDWLADVPSKITEAGSVLAAFSASIGADLVHLHAPALAAEARFSMPVTAVCHSCVATWWDIVETGPLPADLAWRRDLAHRGCRRVDALLAPTDAFATATTRVYALREKPLVVHNGRTRRAVGAVRPAAMPTVFTAGRLWDRGKNLRILDEVAGHLDHPVEAAGAITGPDGARIDLSRIRLLGQLDDHALAGHLDRKPIFASLAHYEPFGLAVLEAAQAGCALVLSDIPTFHELWDGVAWFVDPDDALGAARIIDSLVDDPVARHAGGEAARCRSNRYSVEAMTNGVLDVFRALLVAPPRAMRAAHAGVGF